MSKGAKPDLAKAVGHIRREEDGQVEAAVADVDLRRPNAGFNPIHHAGQPFARPQQVEVLVISVQKAGACRRVLSGDQEMTM